MLRIAYRSSQGMDTHYNYTCPRCSQECSIEQPFVGQKVICPNCSQEFSASPPTTKSTKVRRCRRGGYAVIRVLGLVILVPSLLLCVYLCVAFSAALSPPRSNDAVGTTIFLVPFFGFWTIVGAVLVLLGSRKGWFCKACGTSITEHCRVCRKCHAEFDLPS